jgi:hypothetical protein
VPYITITVPVGTVIGRTVDANMLPEADEGRHSLR